MPIGRASVVCKGRISTTASPERTRARPVSECRSPAASGSSATRTSRSIGSAVGLSTGIASARTPDQSAGSSTGRIVSCARSAAAKSTRAAIPPALTRAPVTWERRAFSTEMRRPSAGSPKRMIGYAFCSDPRACSIDPTAAKNKKEGQLPDHWLSSQALDAPACMSDAGPIRRRFGGRCHASIRIRPDQLE